MGKLKFNRPVRNDVSDPYGSRGGTHHGIDYASPKGTEVRASERGLVVRAADNPKTEKRRRAYGNVIVIYHNPVELEPGKKKRHIYTLYAHLDSMSVSAGDIVHKGQVIGASGDTGMSRGEHLHFELLFAKKKLGWLESSGAMGVHGGEEGAHYRRRPDGYLACGTTAEGTLPATASIPRFRAYGRHRWGG